MTSFNTTRTIQSRNKWMTMSSLTLVSLLALVVWGGLPPDQSVTIFILGAAVLITAVLAFGFAARKLLTGTAVEQIGVIPVTIRRLLALLAAIGGINVSVGGLWDEVWHRKHGIPFGEDLFWRPHLLIYSSFLITIILAGVGYYYLRKNGTGSLWERLKANPVVGMLILTGAYLMFATPADPIWHVIYGEEISAWSLPHIILLISSSLPLLLVAALQLSTLQDRKWSLIWRTPAQELINRGIIIVALALMTQIGLQVLATEWDAGSPIVFGRPDWLLPALLAGYGTLVGLVSNHTTRMAGSSSLTGLLALGIRLSLISAFNYPAVKEISWMILIIPLIGLDVLYVIRVGIAKRPPAWWMSGLTAAASMGVVGLPVINQLYAYPSFDPGNLLPAVITITLTALGASWAGQTVGEYLAISNKQLEETAADQRRMLFIPPAVLVGMVAFIVFFIATASPPVH